MTICPINQVLAGSRTSFRRIWQSSSHKKTFEAPTILILIKLQQIQGRDNNLSQPLIKIFERMHQNNKLWNK